MKNDPPIATNAADAGQNEKDLRLLRHIQHTLTYHQQLLRDRVRNEAFYKALKKHVGKRTSVIDIGSGTGVWAIAAAKLGAFRVVAIEQDKALIPIIEKLASKNGVADRVEVVEGDSRAVELRGRFDLVVSETVGNQGFDEGIVPIMIDARKRFLKRGGLVIPESVALVAAPGTLDGESDHLPAGLNLDYRYLEMLNLDISKNLKNVDKLKMLGRPAPLARVDLRSVAEPPALSELICKWRLPDASQVNCLIVWAQVMLTKGVSLQTIRHSLGWTPVCLPVEPFEKGAAQIECKITISNKQYYWIVTHIKKGHRKVQSHSPMFPYTLIQAHMKQPNPQNSTEQSY